MWMYADDEVTTATVKQVIEVIDNGNIADCDGVHANTWISNLCEYDDLAFDIIQHIVRNRHEKAFAPLVEMIETSIENMLEN